MPTSALVYINVNDTSQDIARKCNYNFRRLDSSQSQQNKSDMRREAERADKALEETKDQLTDDIESGLASLKDDMQGDINKLKDSIKSDIDNLKADMNSLKESIEESLKKAIDELEQKINQSPAPPVGTYIYCTYTPSVIYPGTSWRQIAEGNFLIAAGTNQYKVGINYSSDEVTLTENETPAKFHAIAVPIWVRIS